MKYEIIITEQDNKMNILSNEKNISNKKFMSLSDLEEALLFGVKKKALFKVSKEFGLTYSVTEEILSTIPYINDFKTDNEKILLSLKIKDYLFANDLIITDLAKKTIIMNNDVKIIGYPNTKKIKTLANILNIKLEDNDYSDIEATIYQGRTFEDELTFVLTDILKNKEGNKYSDFSILNLNEKDIPTLKKYAQLYGIPFNISGTSPITLTNEFNKFNSLLKEVNSFDEVLSSIHDPLRKAVINIINDYELEDININQYQSLFTYLLNKKTISLPQYEDSVRLNSLNSKFKYYVNFNEGMAPTILKDEKFFNDEALSKIGLDTTEETNKLRFDEVLKTIALPNTKVTYHNFDSTGKVLASSLISAIKVQEKNINYEFGYSTNADRYYLEHAYEYYQLFGIKNDDLQTYDSKFVSDLFDNSFKFRNKQMYDEYLKNHHINLSYTSCDNYAHCPFKYYLASILNISTFSKTLITNLGTYSHYLLEKSYNENAKEVNFDELFKTPVEKFVAQEFTEITNELINFNKNQEENSEMKDVLPEANIIVDLNDNMSFKGYIDKMIYKIEDDKCYVAIVDYKTSDSYKPTLRNVEYGLNLQLFTYLYLINHLDSIKVNDVYIFKDKEIIFVGAYYQKLLYQNFDKEDEYLTRFMLQGFTTISNSVFKFDSSLSEGISTYIDKLKYDGEIKGTNTISTQLVNEILKLIEKRIEMMKSNIIEMKYDIKPILLSDGTDGCKYCPYKSVCYMRYKDYKHENSKVFGGEIDETSR